jgi:hypothetical protein
MQKHQERSRDRHGLPKDARVCAELDSILRIIMGCGDCTLSLSYRATSKRC